MDCLSWRNSTCHAKLGVFGKQLNCIKLRQIKSSMWTVSKLKQENLTQQKMKLGHSQLIMYCFRRL